MISENKELDDWKSKQVSELILTQTITDIKTLDNDYHICLSSSFDIQDWSLDGNLYKRTLHFDKLDLIIMKDIVEYCLIFNYSCKLFTPSWRPNKSFVIELFRIKDSINEIEIKIEQKTLMEA